MNIPKILNMFIAILQKIYLFFNNMTPYKKEKAAHGGRLFIYITIFTKKASP